MFHSKKQLRKLSDLELVSRYRDTGKSAFVGVIYERYAHLVFGLCLKYLKNEADSKDAVISLFEKLLTDFKKHEITHFKSWLFSVSRNHCLMILRKSQSGNRQHEAYQAELTSNGFEQEYREQPSKEVALSNMEEALKELKPDQKQCIELFYLQQKCYQEVAKITGFSLKQVKSHIQNGKRKLRIILQSSHESISTK